MYEPRWVVLSLGWLSRMGCRLMQTSVNRHLSSHEPLQEVLATKWRIHLGDVSLIARHASTAATRWDDCGCGYKPWDSPTRFLAWVNEAVLSSTDIPYGIHYLVNVTTYTIQSSAWVPAIVFQIHFLSLVVLWLRWVVNESERVSRVVSCCDRTGISLTT